MIAAGKYDQRVTFQQKGVTKNAIGEEVDRLPLEVVEPADARERAGARCGAPTRPRSGGGTRCTCRGAQGQRLHRESAHGRYLLRRSLP